MLRHHLHLAARHEPEGPFLSHLKPGPGAALGPDGRSGGLDAGAVILLLAVLAASLFG